MFECADRSAEGVVSALERFLTPARPARLGVDLSLPTLREGLEWVVDPLLPVHQHSAVDRLRPLLDVGVEALDRAVAATREMARLSAEVATSLATFARCRPAAVLDKQPGERGAMSTATRAARPAALTEVSEWAADELAVALRLPGRTAEAQLCDAVVLAERLPRTLAMLERAELSPAHARKMVDVVGPVADDAVRAAIEARVLGLLGEKTPPQLGDCARRIVLRSDADAAARRLVQAVRARGVRLIDHRDGTGTVELGLPLPVCAAIYRALEAQAEQARTDGDERTKQQRMADVVADLVLRPGEHGLPPVTIALTLVATLETMLGGAEPGQVEGMLVPAEMVRELGYTFGLMPRPAPELDGLPEPTAPEPTAPERTAPERAAPERTAPERAARERAARERTAPELTTPEPPIPEPTKTEHIRAEPAAPTPARDRTLVEWMALARDREEVAVAEGWAGARQAVLDGVWTDGDSRALLDLGALIAVRDLGNTGLAHRPHVAVVDQLRGSLVALTDAPAVRRGRALGPPRETDGYTPGAELDRFVRLRDRRCRFPGCRARARTCDLDHRREWPDGPTSHDNLCCLCEHHHRLKHQAPGWRFDDAPDGALAVTTPGGQVLVSRPPRFGTDLDIPPY